MRCPAMIAAVLVLGTTTGAIGQRPGRCQIEIVDVGHEGRQQTLFGNNSILDAGGRVQLRCRDQHYVRLSGDTMNVITGEVWRIFGGHGIAARYSDSDYAVVADSIIYTKGVEEIQALGHVLITDLKAGSTLRGENVEYFRAVKGVRDEALMNALRRPTVRYFPAATAPRDTAHRAPYVITADQLHGFGESRLSGFGTVLIDRDSLHGRGDSLWFMSGKTGTGQLFGKPASLKRTSADSLAVFGRQIRLDLDGDKLRGIRAFGDGRVARGSSVVIADTVVMAMTNDKLSSTLAWDHHKRATLHNAGYDVAADSIAIDSPDEQLKELRIFRNGLVESPQDSVHRVVAAKLDSAGRDTTGTIPDRDTLWGNRIIARFNQVDSAGTTLTRVREIESDGRARSFSSAMVSSGGKPSPSINYTRADTIIVTMKTGDSTGVSTVNARGHVDGDQEEMASVKQAAVDSTAKKTAGDSTVKKPARDTTTGATRIKHP